MFRPRRCKGVQALPFLFGRRARKRFTYRESANRSR